MNAALEESIEHWKRMRDAETVEELGEEDPYGDHCALCVTHRPRSCRGCPVFLRTGKIECFGSPWRDASSAFLAWRISEVHNLSEVARDRDVWREAADREIAFLESLREAKP